MEVDKAWKGVVICVECAASVVAEIWKDRNEKKEGESNS